MAKLLLVEDDHGLGYILREYLLLHDHEVEWAKDGEAGLSAFQRTHFDLCIFDIMLPLMDGYELARAIRQQDRQVPILFLTSKALKVDKLKAFSIGADDYVVKPVDEEELIARIDAILRRVQPDRPGQGTETIEQIGEFRFDYDNLALDYRGDVRQLTQREADVLRLLCRHRGRILDRKQTLRQLWGEQDYFTRRSMDVFISRLRKYLQRDPRVQITNVHGKGYILSVEKAQ